MCCYSLHVFSPIMVDNYASFFNGTPVGRASDSMMAPSWLGPELLVCCLAHRGSTSVFSLLQIFSNVVWRPVLYIAAKLIVSVSPRFFIYHGG